MRRLADIWTKIIDALFATGAFYLTLIVVATIWDVVARNSALHAPVWLPTFVEFGLPISTMLAAPYLVRRRGHVAMELIDGALSLRNRFRLIRFTDLCAAAISAVIAYYAALGAFSAFARGETIVLAIDVPRWILFAVISVGLFLCAVEFLRHLVRSIVDPSTQSKEV